MLLPGIAGFQPAPVRSDALIAWRTSGTVQTPSWDRRLPACSGSKRCAYRMEDLWNSPNSFLGSRLPACSGWKRGAYRMEVRHPKPLKAVKNGALKVLSPQELERPNLSNLQTLKLIGYTLDGLSRKDLTSFKMKAADD